MAERLGSGLQMQPLLIPSEAAEREGANSFHQRAAQPGSTPGLCFFGKYANRFR